VKPQTVKNPDVETDMATVDATPEVTEREGILMRAAVHVNQAMVHRYRPWLIQRHIHPASSYPCD
jgi:hypothetical protein